MKRIGYPAAFMRGGTSKGIFFRGGVLPDDVETRNRIFLRVLGGGDPYGREIDGLGGATSSTSKAVIVSRSERADADVDYLFAQVGVDRAVVDYRGSCGNLLGAVGPFAIEEGLIDAASGGETLVRIWQVNTHKLIVAHVPTEDALPKEEGTFRIAGVPHTGAEIRLDLMDPGGTSTGKLLPTGSSSEVLDVAGVGPVRVTLLDAATPSVFVRARDFGLRGTESAIELNANGALREKLEAVRAAASVRMGLAESLEAATLQRPGTPRIALVTEPQTYTAPDGTTIDRDAIDLVGRAVSMGAFHHAYQGTSSIATAVAAIIPGTLVNEVALADPARPVRLGHASGIIEVGVTLTRANGTYHVMKASVSRTARRIMAGTVYVPASVLDQSSTAVTA